MRGRVEVASDLIEDAWTASDYYDEVWLRLQTDQVDDFPAVEAAMAAADDAAVERGLDPPGLGAIPCPGGFAIQGEGPALALWISNLVQALVDRGMTGHLGRGVGAPDPSILAGGGPTPTLFVKFRVPTPPDPGGPPGWIAGAKQTREVVDTVLEWALAEPGRAFVSQYGFSTQVGSDFDLHAHFERLLCNVGGGAGVVDVIDGNGDAEWARHLSVDGTGTALFQAVGPSPRATVEELRDLASRLPAPLDCAFLRIAQRGAGGINDIDIVQPLPGILERHVRFNPHLLDRYLPDAHGVQVVTTAHLHAAHDLSRWTVTDLGQDRHLVVAPDLKPWYSTIQPDPDTLARARADWAGALLTEDVIAEHRDR